LLELSFYSIAIMFLRFQNLILRYIIFNVGAFFLILISTTFYCCNHKHVSRYRISGEITGDVPKYIYLYHGNERDSSKVTNGKFYFVGNVKSPVLASLDVPPVSTIEDPFYLENANIDIKVKVEKKDYKNLKVNFIKIEEFLGTETHNSQLEFESFKEKFSNSPDWNQRLYIWLKDYIAKNPKHPYGVDLLSRFARDSTLSFNQIKELYQLVDSTTNAKFSLAEIRKIILPAKRLVKGNNLQNFKLPNKDSIMVSTSKFKGKVLYIDFWASWCKPCRIKNKKLKNIYDHFKNHNFEVLGVSLDTDKKEWIRAMDLDGLQWANVIDLGGLQGRIAANFGITFLPYDMLVDPNGVIIGVNIDNAQLKLILNESLPE